VAGQAIGGIGASILAATVDALSTNIGRRYVACTKPEAVGYAQCTGSKKL